MSRIDRLKEYATPKGPFGASRDQKNLDYWADRATENSKIAPRAKGGKMMLPDTGGDIVMRPTTMKPKEQRAIDRRYAGKDDLNNVDSGNYMRGVRRDA
jgi:hypothetical protein